MGETWCGGKKRDIPPIGARECLRNRLFAKPPACAMLTDSQLNALQIALENAHEGHGFLDRERLPRTMEDQLAIELVSYSVCSPISARLDESARLRSITSTF